MAHFLHVLLVRHASQLRREFLRHAYCVSKPNQREACREPRTTREQAAFLPGTGCCGLWQPETGARAGDAEGMAAARKRAGKKEGGPSVFSPAPPTAIPDYDPGTQATALPHGSPACRAGSAGVCRPRACLSTQSGRAPFVRAPNFYNRFVTIREPDRTSE